MNTAVGDEGGFAPDLASNADAIANIVEAVEKAGYVPGRDIRIALDVAATEILMRRKKSTSWQEKELRRQRRRWLSIMPNCAGKYPIISIEDGLAEEDWEGWKLLTERLGG